MNWVDKHIEIDPPKRTKKMTGTRFASVLGLNKWSTPFEMWCEITKTYEKPFEDTVYTIAGKTIEPKQAEYCRRAYFMRNLVTPSDEFGKDYFNKTYGDFFPDESIFGGMWDYILKDKDGKPNTVLEMKTTKRAEDWEYDIPEYYALQAALYAYLLKVDRVIMVCSFLSDKDYENPDAFVPSAENTILREFRLSERYPAFENEYLFPAMDWWRKYVVTGRSPDYDEKRDAEILKALRKATVDNTESLATYIAEYEQIKDAIAENDKAMKDLTERAKVLADYIKAEMAKDIKDGITSVDLKGRRYVFTLTARPKTSVDEKALKEDGLYDKYAITKTTLYFTSKTKEN